MNCVVDFSEEFSRLTLTERPNSLFQETSQRLCDVAAVPSQSRNSDSSRKPFQHSRSSSSGFSKAETVQQTLRTDRVKCELLDLEACHERQNSSFVLKQSSNSVLQEKSCETDIPAVKSWAAVLTSGKSSQQSASARNLRNQNDEPKLSKSSSVKNTSVTQSRANRSTSRSATRDNDRMQLVSSDGYRDRIKASDGMSVKNCKSQSSARITLSSHDRKSKSQTPQPHSDALVHLTGSHTAVKPKQGEHGKDTGIFDAAAAASSLQSKAAKQKKKKKKLKVPDAAAEKVLDVAERREPVSSHPAPEFDNLSEFPSLMSLKTGSKNTPLQSSDASMAHCTAGIYDFCLLLKQ